VFAALRTLMMKTSRQWGQPVDVATEPIDRDLKACILTELWAHPGARVIKRGGQRGMRVTIPGPHRG
jgi:hypothetical protein